MVSKCNTQEPYLQHYKHDTLCFNCQCIGHATYYCPERNNQTTLHSTQIGVTLAQLDTPNMTPTTLISDDWLLTQAPPLVLSKIKHSSKVCIA